MGCTASHVTHVKVPHEEPRSSRQEEDEFEDTEGDDLHPEVSLVLDLKPQQHDLGNCRNRELTHVAMGFLNCSDGTVHMSYRTPEQKVTQPLRRGKFLKLDGRPGQRYQVRSQAGILLYGITVPKNPYLRGCYGIPSSPIDSRRKNTTLAFLNKTTATLDVSFCMRSREVSITSVKPQHAVTLSAQTGQVFKVYAPNNVRPLLTMVATNPPSDYFCDTLPNVLKPSLRYTENTLEGFKVFLQEHEKNDAESLTEQLEADIKKIRGVIPGDAFEKIRDTTAIYVNRSCRFGSRQFPVEGRGLCTHFSKAWLKSVGLPGKKSGCIEIMCVNDYLRITKTRPWALLHEFAHVYHKLMGLDNEEIIDTYARVMVSRIYERVQTKKSKPKKHPASTCETEYFAECSETYFGCSDLQPFNKEDLKEFDPDGYDMVEIVWKVNNSKPLGQ